MEPEIDLVTLPEEEWGELLATASVLDLVHGGYYRARPGAILFYCGPENAPAGWAGGFSDGSPGLPRAAVGEAEVSERTEANEVIVRLSVSNWPAVRELKRAYDRGDYAGRYQEFVLDQERALRGRTEDRAWLREQFRRLREHAGGGILSRGPGPDEGEAENR